MLPSTGFKIVSIMFGVINRCIAVFKVCWTNLLRMTRELSVGSVCA